MASSWTRQCVTIKKFVQPRSECSEKSGKELRTLSRLCEVGKISEMASRSLKEEVFTIMRNDEISRTAQKDLLIVSLGNMWLLKNIDNKLKRKSRAWCKTIVTSYIK